jgi:hypothetical protein
MLIGVSQIRQWNWKLSVHIASIAVKLDYSPTRAHTDKQYFGPGTEYTVSELSRREVVCNYVIKERVFTELFGSWP